MKKLLLAAAATLALAPSLKAQTMGECTLDSNCGQLRYVVTYNHDKTLSFTMVSAPTYFSKGSEAELGPKIADISKVGGVHGLTNYQYTTETTYNPGETVTFKWYLEFPGGLASSVKTYTVPETTASATDATWAMGIHRVDATETSLTFNYLFINVTPKVESTPGSYTAHMSVLNGGESADYTTATGAIEVAGLTKGQNYACYVKGQVDGKNTINYDRDFHFSTKGGSEGENPEQPSNWTLGDFNFLYSDPAQAAGNDNNSVNLSFKYNWENAKNAPVKEVIFGAVAAAGDALAGVTYDKWPGDAGILVGQTTIAAADLVADGKVDMLIHDIRSNGATTLYMKSSIVLEDGKTIEGPGNVWQADPSQFIAERTITNTCTAAKGKFSYTITYQGFADADVQSVNVYLVEGGQGIDNAAYTTSGKTGSIDIAEADQNKDYWVKARIVFTDGTTKDFNLNNDQAMKFNQDPETPPVDPSGLMTMEKLGATAGWYNGTVAAAEFDGDNKLIMVFPKCFTDQGITCDNGLSGHYPQVEGTYAPELKFSVGNDANGHVVGIIDYPTPLPNGLDPQVFLNNSARVKPSANETFTADNGIEYTRYYFSSKNATDKNGGTLANEAVYVKDETLSYFFYAGFEGGMHRTRTYSWKMTDSSKDAREHTITNIFKKGGFFSGKLIDENSDHTSIEIYHIDALPENVPGPSKTEAGWDYTAHPVTFGAPRQEDGTYPLGYSDDARYWHPGFTYAIANDPDEATGENGSEGSLISVAIRFDEGTLIPGALVASFELYSIDAEGKETAIEAGDFKNLMQVIPGEVNLYGGVTKNRYKNTIAPEKAPVRRVGEDEAGTEDTEAKLGVKFRFEYHSIRKGAGFSNTKLRNYEVSNEDKEHTAIDSVADDAANLDAPVEYYNLQGMRVANPEGGIFIQRQGNRVTKVMIP